MSDTNNRIFQVGMTTITEDDSTRGMTPQQVKTILKRAYPEIANAEIKETTRDDGTQVIQFVAKPGRKG
jgi:PRTRC genetic system protein C